MVTSTQPLKNVNAQERGWVKSVLSLCVEFMAQCFLMVLAAVHRHGILPFQNQYVALLVLYAHVRCIAVLIKHVMVAQPGVRVMVIASVAIRGLESTAKFH